ncbi:MAG: hypothetical protein H7124_12285 [Phycisphaerales bacterium]|nr:hypothetical protein [Hyphomonadaceae bacterium]
MSDKRSVTPVAMANNKGGSAFFDIRVPGGVIRSVDRDVLRDAIKCANTALSQAAKTQR